jgi:DnaJ-class molecular chaperone
MNSIPHKCPVCYGTGLVSRPPWVPGDVNEWQASGIGPYTCRTCFGRGVIWSSTCRICGGTGQDDPPPGKYHGLCIHCGGSGQEPPNDEGE